MCVGLFLCFGAIELQGAGPVVCMDGCMHGGEHQQVEINSH